jgi:AbrB family looped-hinge helix DNA binding protein
MKTRVSSKGQIVLPAELRERDGVRAGQEFEIERISDGEYRLVRQTPVNAGVVDWLLSCPVKDSFEPLPPGESTDSIRPDFS